MNVDTQDWNFFDFHLATGISEPTGSLLQQLLTFQNKKNYTQNKNYISR